MTTEVDASFTAVYTESARVSATWGQHYMVENLGTLLGEDAHTNLRTILRLPRGVGLASVEDGVRAVVEAHEALGTVVRARAGAPAEQLLSSSVDVSMVAIRSTVGRAYGAALELEARLAADHFDWSVDCPIRFGVVIGRRDEALFLTIAISHVAADAASLGFLRRAFLVAIAGGGEHAGGANNQPRVQSASESTSAALEHSAASARYWEETFRAGPARGQLRRREPESPRFWEGSLPAAEAWADAVSRSSRWKCGPATVAMAATAVGVARVTGLQELLVQVRTSNRFPGPMRDMVGQLSQEVPVIIQVDVDSVEETARALHRRTLTALTFGHYAPADVAAVRRRLSAEGIDASRGGMLMNVVLPEQRPSPQPSPARRSEVSWVGSRERDETTAFFDIAPGRSLNALADTGFLSRDELEQVLHESVGAFAT